jgi:undecaprenyl-diphosphatase
MNKYFTVTIGLLMFFVLLSILVSPNINSTDSTLIKADNSAFISINKSHISALDQFMVYLTFFGREYFWIPVIILLFIFGGWAGKKAAISMAISFLILIYIGNIAKDIVHRERPFIPKEMFIIKADSESAFPSGHAVIVSAGAANILMLFYGPSVRRKVISICLTVEAGLVCFSRIYVGGHYPLDVLAGIVLGVAVSLIFIGVIKHTELVFANILNIFKLSRNNNNKEKTKSTEW